MGGGNKKFLNEKKESDKKFELEIEGMKGMWVEKLKK